MCWSPEPRSMGILKGWRPEFASCEPSAGDKTVTPTSSVYVGVVSARSRRLRTIGSLLLLTIALMTLYGYFFLMPSINRAVEARRTAQVKVTEIHAAGV